MKKLYTIISLAALATIALNQTLSAVPAYPGPISITQPDGTSLTIRIHGDEFLNWTTCGNTLVAIGDDGFYHYASFDTDCITKATGTRVTSNLSGDGSSVRPPVALIQKANNDRKQMSAAAKSIRQTAVQKSPAGQYRFLVMLIEFNDLPFTVNQPGTAFHNLLNQKGYSENGATGSVYDYYSDQSTGQFDPIFDVCGPYKVSGNMSSYSDNDGLTQNGAPRLLAEACQLADPEIDFSQYDIDKDGYIDNVFFYYAGHNSAEGASGTIWPHSWEVQKTVILDGVRLFGYACASEYDGASGQTMASIGTYCHEFGHVVGLPDFYDTDYEDQGEGIGLYKYSLMSHGCYNNNQKTPPYFNCEERMLLGWMTSIPYLPVKSGKVTVQPVQTNAGYIAPTDNEGEYFYYEYRNGKGWDKPLNPGLVIYHIDKSNNVVAGYTAKYRWENWYGINDVAEHECFKLMFAKKDSVIPFGGSYSSFTSKSTSQALSWGGTETGYDLTDISYDGEKATFHLTNVNADLFSKNGICAIETAGDWKAGDTFTFQLVETENPPTAVTWFFDEKQITTSSVVLTSGVHEIVALLVWSNGDSGYYGTTLKVK